MWDLDLNLEKQHDADLEASDPPTNIRPDQNPPALARELERGGASPLPAARLPPWPLRPQMGSDIAHTDVFDITWTRSLERVAPPTHLPPDSGFGDETHRYLPTSLPVPATAVTTASLVFQVPVMQQGAAIGSGARATTPALPASLADDHSCGTLEQHETAPARLICDPSAQHGDVEHVVFPDGRLRAIGHC